VDSNRFPLDGGGLMVGRVRCSIGGGGSPTTARGSGDGLLSCRRIFHRVRRDLSGTRIHRLGAENPVADATVAQICFAGGPVSDPKPAVEGGRIASVWSEHLKS